MNMKMLKKDVYLVKLDKRSGTTFEHFQHRIDIHGAQNAIDFLYWVQTNLGMGLPWNLYYSVQGKPEFEIPKWAVRYNEAGSNFTQLFIRSDMVPLIMLTWQGAKNEAY